MTGNVTEITITVLMPACNAGRFLAGAIESVLGQTHPDFDFIIIDDGSVDDTLVVAQSYAARDRRIKIITHANMGMGRSLNQAMPLAQGQWICRIDADDEMEPQRLERQIEFLRANPDVVVASALTTYIDDNGRTIGKHPPSRLTTREGVSRFVRRHQPVIFSHPSAIFRKDIILKLGGYRPAFWPADDMDLWNRVVDAGYTVLVQPEYLTKYRIHQSSVTIRHVRATEEKIRWVEACIMARHHGRAEPPWEQFCQRWNGLSWRHRVKLLRRDYAQTLYKAAVLDFSRRQWWTFLTSMTAATVMDPPFALSRVLPRLRYALISQKARAPSPHDVRPT